MRPCGYERGRAGDVILRLCGCREHRTYGNVVRCLNRSCRNLPDGVRADWWRITGHSLHIDDLAAVLAAKVHTLIVGRGAYGLMAVPGETRQALETAGIEVLALPTKKACEAYNARCDERTVAAALHLSC